MQKTLDILYMYISALYLTILCSWKFQGVQFLCIDNLSLVDAHSVVTFLYLSSRMSREACSHSNVLLE